jgi:hypothetical protein
MVHAHSNGAFINGGSFSLSACPVERHTFTNERAGLRPASESQDLLWMLELDVETRFNGRYDLFLGMKMYATE